MIGKNFILAGKATFTLKIPADFAKMHGCKEHYTFRVDFVPANGKYGDTWFVKLLSGPDNTSDYQLFGMLDPSTGSMTLTRRTTMTNESWPVKFARRIFARVADDSLDVIFDAGFSIMHAGKCGRCGRKLTTPKSLEIGLGPTCADAA